MSDTTTRPKIKKMSTRALEAVGRSAVTDTRVLLGDSLMESGLSVQDLSTILGVTRSNIYQTLTKNDGNPTLKMVARWLYAMGYRLVLSFEPIEK